VSVLVAEAQMRKVTVRFTGVVAPTRPVEVLTRPW
jgi:hypothetical protein